MQNKKNVKRNNKGFSLVELIVVIAIMAVLVGVVAPQFIKYVEKSRQATDIQNISSIGTAIQTYCADHTLSASVTITLNGTMPGASTDEGKILDNAKITSVTAKGTSWTAVPSVTYDPSTNKLEYAGTSTYYSVNTDKSGYDAN